MMDASGSYQSGAELFVAALEAAGIDRIYGIPGEENTALIQALAPSSIDFVLTRHEQGAAFMASVHGRLSGRPAACLSTLGPGATNLVTGVADAWLDRVPMLVITAQAGRDTLDQGVTHQVLDLAALFQPVTKASHVLHAPEAIPGAVAEAVRTALEPHPGPVHISLPEDVAAARISAPVITLPETSVPLPNPARLLVAANALRDASQPVLLVGPGVLRAQACEQLRYMAERLNIPVVTSLAAKGMLPASHPLTLFALGMPFKDHIDRAMSSCDLIVAVGFDPVEYSAAALTHNGRIPVVHLDERAAPIDAGWQVVADVVGSLPASLKGLAAALDSVRWDLSAPMRQAQDAIRSERHWLETPGDAMRARPGDICHVIGQDLREEDTVISGVGAHKMWIARNLPARRPGQVIIPNGLAGMGLALPGAIAAAGLADAGRVLAVCGDGDFLMNVQEMETARRLGRPLTVMVWDDGAYGLIEWEQQRQSGQSSDLSFFNPDWASLARAFDWCHLPMTRFADLSDLLEQSRGETRPCLITVAVDYGENIALSDTTPGTLSNATR